MRVVIAASPIYNNIRLAGIERPGAFERCRGADLAIFVGALEEWAFSAKIVSRGHEIMATIRATISAVEKGNVIVCVKTGEVLVRSCDLAKCTGDVHLHRKTIVDDKVVGHSNTMGFEGVAEAAVVIADVVIIEIGNPGLRQTGIGGCSSARASLIPSSLQAKAPC